MDQQTQQEQQDEEGTGVEGIQPGDHQGEQGEGKALGIDVPENRKVEAEPDLGDGRRSPGIDALVSRTNGPARLG